MRPNTKPKITYRFRCVQCPYVSEVPEQHLLPSQCPACGTKRAELRIVKKGKP